MRKYQNVIGIDPDCEKSGVAWLHTEDRKLEVMNFPFPKLIEYLKHCKEVSEKAGESYMVIVEAGWLHESHWHLGMRDSRRVAAAKGNSVGRNHETGRKIVEMCEYYGINVDTQAPLKKCWLGRDGKITHKELQAFTGIMGRTNQDGRDAALLAWCYADLPIRFKV